MFVSLERSLECRGRTKIRVNIQDTCFVDSDVSSSPCLCDYAKCQYNCPILYDIYQRRHLNAKFALATWCSKAIPKKDLSSFHTISSHELISTLHILCYKHLLFNASS